MTHPLIRATGLTVEYGGKRLLPFGPRPAAIQAVSNVSFDIARGETLAVVGESGCGKSTLGRALLRSAPLSAGTIELDGRDITALSGNALRHARRQFQMVFQDPYASLNPRMKIFDTLAEPLRVHTGQNPDAVRTAVHQMMEAAGLDRDFARRYPHEFSGGQRQRIAIARAAILRPDFIVADEPFSALDVSLQVQILRLFGALKDQFGLTYLLISHDLARVFGFADRIAVMYLGKIVEIGPSRSVFARASHPYTRALIAAAPSPDPAHRPDEALRLHGELPSPANPPKGCRFHTRCPLVEPRCRIEEPLLRAVQGAADHQAACHLVPQA